MDNEIEVKHLYWLSWLQPTEDYRPLHDPPNDAILGWWCSGVSESEIAILCAGVRASSEDDAKTTIKREWPEANTWRFCDIRPDYWNPGDRFPLKGWAKDRWAS